MGAMEWMVMYIILLDITSNKGCGVWATTIECQNAFVSIQCCALCGGQNKCDYKLWYKVQMHVLKVCSVHSILSLWKSKRMATYMQHIRNNNLEIRIAGSSSRLWLSFIQIQTCQYNILANSFWVKLIKHEIFVLLWQEFLKTSQLLPHISNNFPRTCKLFQKMCEVVLTTIEQFWSYFKCQREIELYFCHQSCVKEQFVWICLSGARNCPCRWVKSRSRNKSPGMKLMHNVLELAGIL